MNYSRIALAALGGTVAYFAIGFLVFTMKPFVAEFQKYPAIYRSRESMKGVMPFGMLGMLHNYVNLNIGLKLTIEQAIAYFVEWTVVGLVIGLIYRVRV